MISLIASSLPPGVSMTSRILIKISILTRPLCPETGLEWLVILSSQFRGHRRSTVNIVISVAQHRVQPSIRHTFLRPVRSCPELLSRMSFSNLGSTGYTMIDG